MIKKIFEFTSVIMPIQTRQHILSSIFEAETEIFDIVIIGGGATGLGCAVDAMNRGYKTLLIEQSDFGSGTSSKSTKLLHGGVRYLEQGNISLVYEALKERGILLNNAPHLVSKISFIIPNYSYFSGPYFALGLKLYDLLSWKRSFGASEWISKEEVLEYIPNLKSDDLKSGVVYRDGQFDDTRLLVSLLRTFQEMGGIAINYARFTDFLYHDSGRIDGIQFLDRESGQFHEVRTRAVVNATGNFATDILQKDNPSNTFRIKPSQGTHIVVDNHFLPGGKSILIPKTDDGRVLFMIPWYDKVLVGTTDVELEKNIEDPIPGKEEINFILETLARYLDPAPGPEDIRSVFAGIRPLVAPENGTESTKNVSREHKVMINPSGLVTISGGKWTTYRKMAEDTINAIIESADLPEQECETEQLLLFGATEPGSQKNDSRTAYGSEMKSLHDFILQNPSYGDCIHPDLDILKVQVLWACKYEMARTIEDVLARRTRALFLDAKAALESAPLVVKIMDEVLGNGTDWQTTQLEAFEKIAGNFIYKG